MIFVCTGTQVYQFDRLLKKIDELIKAGFIKDEVFAQIGSSTYRPVNYQYVCFQSEEDFKRAQASASLIISHGGTGALIGALKLGKNVIAVPRLAAFKEHVDNHQFQIVEVLEKQGYLRAVYDIEKLKDVMKEAMEKPITKIYQRESNVLPIVIDYIERKCKK